LLKYTNKQTDKQIAGAVLQQDNKCKVNIHASTDFQNFSYKVHVA